MTNFSPVARPHLRSFSAFALLFIFGLTALPRSGICQSSPDLTKLLAEKSEALVTVQSVCQVEGSGPLATLLAGGEEFASEATCLMIDTRGIVLCSHTQLTGLASLTQRFLGPAAHGVKLSVTPVRLTIFLNGGGERFNARLLARDPDLDLAWLEIVNPDGRKFSFVDTTRGVEPKIGDRIFVMQRLDEYFDRAVVAFEGQIGGITRLPRLLYVPTIQLEASFGLPVLTPGGDLIGLTVLQLAREDDSAETSGTLGSIRQATRLRSLARAFILPARAMSSATARVLASAPQPPTPGRK